jgi:putative protease
MARALEPIGRVVRFYAKAHAAAVRLEGTLRVGERVYVRGWTTDFQQLVTSLHINHLAVEAGQPGDLVGMMTVETCRPRDVVYRLSS